MNEVNCTSHLIAVQCAPLIAPYDNSLRLWRARFWLPSNPPRGGLLVTFLWPRKEKLLGPKGGRNLRGQRPRVLHGKAVPACHRHGVSLNARMPPAKGAWPPLSAQERFPVLNTGCNPACRTAAATSPPDGRRGWQTVPAPLHPLRHSPRLGARLYRHLGDAKAHRAVAKGGRLAGREGQVQGGREEAPGADQLGQLPIRHDHGRLQPTGAGAQAREGERIAALPVVALKPAQVLGDKVAVSAPVRGETDERPKPILSIPAR